MGCLIGKKHNQYTDVIDIPSKLGHTLTEIDEQKLALKVKIREVKKCQTKMEEFIYNCNEKAKKSIAEGRKDKALFVLKMKRLYQQSARKSMKIINTLEETTLNLESALMDNSVLNVMRESESLISILRSNSKLEDFEKQFQEIEVNKEE